MPGNGHGVQIIVAVIGVVGTITVGLFANWDKIFSNDKLPEINTVVQQATVQQNTPQQFNPSSLTVTHIKIINDSDNIGAGEIYGFIKVNNEIVWEGKQNNTIKVDTGNNLNINKTIKLKNGANNYHVVGQIIDDDAYSTGADDNIGIWDFHVSPVNKGKDSKQGDSDGRGLAEIFFIVN